VKCIWAACVFLSPAALMAEASNEFYIAQDASTKQCTIVEVPPNTTELVLVEKGLVYFQRGEAERVMASLTLCTLLSSRSALASTSTPAIRAEVRRHIKPKRQATVYKKPAVSATAIAASSPIPPVALREQLSSF